MAVPPRGRDNLSLAGQTAMCVRSRADSLLELRPLKSLVLILVMHGIRDTERIEICAARHHAGHTNALFGLRGDLPAGARGWRGAAAETSRLHQQSDAESALLVRRGHGQRGSPAQAPKVVTCLDALRPSHSPSPAPLSPLPSPLPSSLPSSLPSPQLLLRLPEGV